MRGCDDIERARSALFALDAGCPREQWVRLGMAAKDSGLGFDDFHRWSTSGANYQSESDCNSVWRSIDAGGGVGSGTLFGLARDAGWQDPTKTQYNGILATRAPSAKPNARPEPKAARKPHIVLAEVFERYPPAPLEHSYIAAKCGTPDGLRVVPHDDPLIIRGQRVAGCLAVPVRSLDGELRTIQYIPPPGTGSKLNAAGASFGNGMFTIGEISRDGRVYVCEGIGQAWSCTRADYHAAAVVAFGCGRFPVVGLALRKRFPAARLVFVSDRGKEAKAEAVAREAGGAWVEMPCEKPDNYDANDYAADHGSEALADLLHAAKTPPMRYRLQSADDLLNAPPLRWLVRGVLPADGLVALYGPSGSGKSFLALDLCAAIADGAPEWFGRQVSAAPVTYLGLEGERGLGKRIRAWSIRNHRAPPTRLRFVTQPMDLRQQDDVADLAAAVLAAGGRDGLLVIDTLNRAAPGADENASTDMGELIEACKDLQRLAGGVVMLVHHTGKDGARGLRGHSSLYAALDAAIEVSRSDSRREWSIAKSKDDADGERNAFLLQVVELGDDEFGELETSCVIGPDDNGSTHFSRALPPKSGNQKVAWDALGELLRQTGDARPIGAPESLPAGRPVVMLSDAIDCVRERLACEAKRKTERAQQALSGLHAKKLIRIDREFVWMI